MRVLASGLHLWQGSDKPLRMRSLRVQHPVFRSAPSRCSYSEAVLCGKWLDSRTSPGFLSGCGRCFSPSCGVRGLEDGLRHTCCEPQVGITSITPVSLSLLGVLLPSDRIPSMFLLQHIPGFLWSVVGCIFLSNTIRILICVRILSIYL